MATKVTEYSLNYGFYKGTQSCILAFSVFKALRSRKLLNLRLSLRKKPLILTDSPLMQGSA